MLLSSMLHPQRRLGPLLPCTLPAVVRPPPPHLPLQALSQPPQQQQQQQQALAALHAGVNRAVDALLAAHPSASDRPELLITLTELRAAAKRFEAELDKTGGQLSLASEVSVKGASVQVNDAVGSSVSNLPSVLVTAHRSVSRYFSNSDGALRAQQQTQPSSQSSQLQDARSFRLGGGGSALSAPSPSPPFRALPSAPSSPPGRSHWWSSEDGAGARSHHQHDSPLLLGQLSPPPALPMARVRSFSPLAAPSAVLFAPIPAQFLPAPDSDDSPSHPLRAPSHSGGARGASAHGRSKSTNGTTVSSSRLMLRRSASAVARGRLVDVVAGGKSGARVWGGGPGSHRIAPVPAARPPSRLRAQSMGPRVGAREGERWEGVCEGGGGGGGATRVSAATVARLAAPVVRTGGVPSRPVLLPQLLGLRAPPPPRRAPGASVLGAGAVVQGRASSATVLLGGEDGGVTPPAPVAAASKKRISELAAPRAAPRSRGAAAAPPHPPPLPPAKKGGEAFVVAGAARQSLPKWQVPQAVKQGRTPVSPTAALVQQPPSSRITSPQGVEVSSETPAQAAALLRPAHARGTLVPLAQLFGLSSSQAPVSEWDE